MPKAKIVDLSHHQANVQFGDLKAAGIEAVILKATDGVDRVDPRFHEYVERARPKGLLVGAYHFMSGQDANTQLDLFLSTVSEHRPMLLALDYEANGFRGHPTPEVLNSMVVGMVQRLNRHPVLYGSDGDYLGPLLRSGKAHASVLKCRRWIARYNPLLSPKTPCDIWQYTQTGRIAGMGPLDLNAFIAKEFKTVSEFWNRWSI